MRTTIATSLGVTLLCGAASAQGFFQPAQMVDVNPDPNIVEVNLEAKPIQWEYFPVSNPGVLTSVWAYGDQETGVFSVPGPRIEGQLGQTIIVNFTNNLPEETTVHWHGVESPATSDGSHIAQTPVPPGGTFQYVLPVNNDALYWYHPHVRPFDGVEKGLQGILVFRDPAKEAALGLDTMDETIIVADDILLDAALQVVPAFSFTDPLQNANYQLNGREGNYFLINGKASPDVNLNVRNGKPHRLRVINSANTTFVRLDLQDAVDGISGELWEIGSDGGLLEDPQMKPKPVTPTGPNWPGPDHPGQVLLSEMGQGILLLPAERMDVVFTPIGTPDEVFTIYQWDWFRGRHAATYNSAGMIVLPDDPMDGAYPTKVAMTMTVKGDDPGTGEWTPPGNWSAVAALPPQGNPIGSLPVTFGHSMPDMMGNVTLFVQAMMTMVPGQGMVMTPLPAPLIDSFNAHDVNEGETWEWTVTNLTHGDHPFHAHGFFFELLEYEWQDDLNPNDPTLNFNFVPWRRRMKDTIRIPARLGAKGTSRSITRLLTTFDPTGRDISASGMLPTYRPDGSWESGGWLFHCHILEHSGKGMLSVLEVHDPNDPFTLLGKHKGSSPSNYPSLTATGDLSPGSTVVVDLVNATPNKKIWLVVGDYAAHRPIAGGELVPGTSPPFTSSPFLTVMGAVADANGNYTWNLTQWDTFPSGFEFYMQAAARDPGSVGKLALSNAIKFTKP